MFSSILPVFFRGSEYNRPEVPVPAVDQAEHKLIAILRHDDRHQEVSVLQDPWADCFKDLHKGVLPEIVVITADGILDYLIPVQERLDLPSPCVFDKYSEPVQHFKHILWKSFPSLRSDILRHAKVRFRDPARNTGQGIRAIGNAI